MSDTPEPERRWAGRIAAAAYLGVHPSSLDRLADAGRITRYKVGHLARFDLAEIDRMVLAGAQPTSGGGE